MFLSSSLRLAVGLSIFFLSLKLVNSANEAKDPSKKRVVLIGLDGFDLRCYQKGLFGEKGFGFVEANGSYTYKARTAIEAVSGPGWSNILCGQDTEDTGIINNEWIIPMLSREYSKITPVSGAANPINCVYQELKKNKADLKIKTSLVWDFLLFFGNQFNPNSVDVEELCMPYNTEAETKSCDLNSKDLTLKFIKDDFDFIFSYFGSLDEIGHITEFCSNDYTQQLATISSYINEVIETLKTEGIYDNTYIIITSDHGSNPDQKNHGMQTDSNLLIPWWISGPNIKKNYEIEQLVRNYDTPATILKLFGYESNELWRGKSVSSVFQAASNLK